MGPGSVNLIFLVVGRAEFGSLGLVHPALELEDDTTCTIAS
jgi:hypothetical protein